MTVSKTMRWIVTAAAVMAAVAVTTVILVASNLAFSVLDRLYDVSPWLAIAYLILLGGFAAASGIAIWLLLAPREKPTSTTSAPPEEHQLRVDIDRHARDGVDVESVRTELEQLEQRRSSGEVYVALYGEISHGKSSLIRALVPGAQPEVDVRGGTTQTVSHYSWKTPAGDKLILADVPGFNQADEKTQLGAREEALRAHLVVYLCDGDLTRDQWEELKELRRFGKPTIIAINKKDRYRAEDLGSIRDRIHERLSAETSIAAIQTGGVEEVIRVLPNGQEQRIERKRPVDVEDLLIALQNQLVEQGEVLTRLRDNTVFLLAAGKLDSAISEYRHKTADELVEKYTRRAVIGGLAAFAPGSDLVIQGTLAVALVRAMCRLYDIPVRQIDLDRLIKAAAGKVGKPTPLLLAVAGNALKAFPGTGTLAGGLAHAVAYGLLFQSLGRALASTIATQGDLDTRLTIQAFEENLGEDLAARAKNLATMAISQARRSRK